MQDQTEATSGGNFVSHDLIRKDSLEERTYQREVAEICTEQNTLAILPTGLGKTAIALLVVAHYLSESSDSRALILSPTRVLANQHYEFVKKHLNINADQIGVITGEDSSEDRKAIWEKRIVCATPQVIVSEITSKNCKLENYALIIFDEVHRAIGNHAYSTIASIYSEFRKDGRMVGITASLPSEREKIEEIVSKLKVEKIEIRDEKSEDVKPYVYNTETKWIEVSLSLELASIQKKIREALDYRLKMIEDASLIKRSRYGSISMRDLLALRAKVDQVQSSQLRNALFSSIRLFHALNLIETQSLSTFKNFMDRMFEKRRGYGMSELINDPRVKGAYDEAILALQKGVEHPKLEQVLKLVKSVNKGERAIVFASYRDTVDQIYTSLKRNGFRAGYLIGKSGEGGQNQKKQIDSLQQLREGVFDILVATQVGEEGLDVAECNLVIFYDNVPSAVRFVQRKGRTGRRREGQVFVLITKGTRDETYYWLSRRRAGAATKIAASLVKTDKKGPLDKFVSQEKAGKQAPLIYVDTREIPELVEKLRYRGAEVIVKQLDFGDYVISSDIVIERKTLDDFVKSIFDGRLFQQLANMTKQYPRPLLIIEGEKKRHVEGIGEAAYFGALASVLADFKVPIFFASNHDEVTGIVFHIARREQMEKKRDIRIREGKKPSTIAENQLFVASGLPGVSNVLADRLLSEFETLERLFSSSELELLKVEGIGPGTAKKIRQLSSAKYAPVGPEEIKELAERDRGIVETEPEDPSQHKESTSRAKKSENISSTTVDEFLDIPPPED